MSETSATVRARQSSDSLTCLRAEADIVCGSPVPPFGGRRPGPRRLIKAPAAVHPSPQGGEGIGARISYTMLLGELVEH